MDIHIPFGWFYLFNLLVLAGFLIGYGIRKGYPMTVWMTIVAWLSLFFLIGMKLMTASPGDWPSLMFEHHTEPLYRKFVPGGVLFAWVGWLLVRRLLHVRAPVMDGLILILPLLVAVQRVGCFLNGCCFGKATSLPWAVAYPDGTPAYAHFEEAGLVPPGEALSCTVHPVQLYTLAGALLVFFLILHFRHSWRHSGSRALFGLILLATLRFVMEFFREPDPRTWPSRMVGPVNLLQWIILAVIILGILVLWRRERSVVIPAAPPTVQEDPRRNVIALLILILLYWNGSRLMEFPEMILAGSLLASAVVLNMTGLMRRAGRPVLRYGTFTLLGIAFVTMSQQAIRQEGDSIRQDPDHTWFSAGLLASGGQYDEVIRTCDGTVTDRRSKGQVAGSASLILHHQPSPTHRFDYGLNAWVLRDKYLSGDPLPVVHYGFTPFVGYNLTTRGLNLLEINAGATYSPTNYMGSTSGWYPLIYLRIGPRERFFVDGGVANELLQTGRPNFFQAGIGTGIKKLPGSTIRFGLSLGPETNWLFSDNLTDDDGLHLYLTGDLHFRNGLTLKPGLYVINKAFVTLGFHYDFGLLPR